MVISWLSERKLEAKLPDLDPTEIQRGGQLCSRSVVDGFVEVIRDQVMG